MKLRIAIAMASAVLLSSCAASVAPPAAPSVAAATTATAEGGARAQAVTIHATVEKVDLKNRKVTLKGFDGTTETVTVGEEVRNLAQVKRGDQVVVAYYQSVAFEVLKRGDKREEVTIVEGAGRAEQGEQPGAIAATVITVVADVVRLDREKRTAVLRGPEGNLTTVDVRNPAAFDKVKVGDRVEITLTEAMAIDVQPAAPN